MQRSKTVLMYKRSAIAAQMVQRLSIEILTQRESFLGVHNCDFMDVEISNSLIKTLVFEYLAHPNKSF